MPMLFLDRQLQGDDFMISDTLKTYLAEYCQCGDYRPEFRRRSHLFVPLNKEHFLAKIGRGEIDADTFIFDLEDSVPAAYKPVARASIALLPPKPRHVEYNVRINSGDPEQVELDIPAIANAPFDSVTLAKGESGEGVLGLMRRIGEDKAYAISIETIRGLKAVDEIAAVLRPGRDALGFGVGDMSTDLGVERMSTCENPLFQQIMGMISIAAKRYGLDVLDSVSARFNDPENARKEAQLAYRCFGYTGKKLINPKQLDVINTVFSPAHAEIANHLETLETFLNASQSNARVVGGEYKGLPAFLTAERQVKRYLRQGYLTLAALHTKPDAPARQSVSRNGAAGSVHH